MTTTNRRPFIQWLVLTFLLGVVIAGMWFGRNDPDTDWGPIILGAMALIGLVVRTIFKVPADDDEAVDGYASR